MKIEMNKIKITLPDSSTKEFAAGVTPLEIAQSISSRLAKEALVAKINGIVKDLNTPINENSEVAILTFNDPEGRHAYWHSTSHLMAHAIQALHPEAKFGVGPAIETGFYYDIDVNTQLTEDDLRKIEEKMVELSKQDNPFKRKELPKVEAVKFFEQKGDNFKLEILSELDDEMKLLVFMTKAILPIYVRDRMFLQPVKLNI